MNVGILALAAVIPMIVGAIWYHPKVLGAAWMRASGVTEEQVQGGNMFVIFGLAYLFSFFLAFALHGMVVHQSGIVQLLATDPDFGKVGSEVNTFFTQFMADYGERHRSFGHGALHGGIAAVVLALPIVGILALFERRGAKYVGVHFGYWLLAFVLMGGVICAFA